MDDDRKRLPIGAYAIAAVLAVVLALRFFAGGGDGGGTAVALDEAAPAGGSSGSAVAPNGSGRKPTQVWVHVAGAVRRPGLYRVDASARAGVAVDAAGGVTRRADLTAINLAAPLKDGQQVIVPVRGAAVAGAGGAGGASSGAGGTPGDAGAGATGGGAAGPAGSGGATGGGAAAGGKISLSTATVEQLDTLDGLGPTLAQRIIDWREAHGGFKSVEQLREIEGIGEKRFAALREAVVP